MNRKKEGMEKSRSASLLLSAVACGALFAMTTAGGPDGWGAAALPMPTGKATVVKGLGRGDVVTSCVPVRVGNVVTALNKKLEMDPRSGRITLVVDDDTVFTCGESYCFVDGKTGMKSWGVFSTGPRSRKWHSRIENREDGGTYVTEAFLRTSSGEEYLQNRTTMTVLPDGIVKATFEGFPSRDESIVKIDNPGGLYFGGGAKALPGSAADFNGRVVTFDDNPSFKTECNGLGKNARDYSIIYYKGDEARQFGLTVAKGFSGTVGWGVWTKGTLHGSFGATGVKTVYIDVRSGVRRATNPDIRGGIDWRAIEGLEMPEERKNLFENVSFERGWRCWDSFKLNGGKGFTPARWDVEFFAIDDKTAHSGRRSLRCYAPEWREEHAVKHDLWGYATMSTTLCPVPDPGRYTVSFWARATDTNVLLKAWCPAFSYTETYPRISRYLPKTKETYARFFLTKEWRRHSFSFDLPKADPLKLVFVLGTPMGTPQGYAWIDDVQFERGGEATQFEAPAAEGELVMSDPDQFCDPDRPLEARLNVYAAEKGEVRVEVRSFLGEPIFSRTYQFAPEEGRAVVALDGLDESLPGSGVYKMKRTFKLASGRAAFEHDRFTVARSLDFLPRRWRFIQSNYGDPFENTEVLRELARWRRIGIDRLYGPETGLNREMYALVKGLGMHPGFFRIGGGRYFEEVRPDPKNPRKVEKRQLKGAIGSVDYDMSRPRLGSLTNAPGVNVYLVGHRDLGMDLDGRYLKMLEDAAAAKVARYPFIRQWECSSEINCALGYDYWSDDHDWDHQMRNFSKWLAAIYRGAKRADPKLMVSNDSAMNMSDSCLAEIKATLRYCAEMGVKFDAIGAHTYRYSPESPDLDDGFKTLTEAAVALGYPADVPLVCGEGMHWGPYEVRAWGLKSANWQNVPESWWSAAAALSYDIGRTEIRSAAWRARSWLVGYKYAKRMLEMNSGNTNNFQLDANQTPFLSQIISSVLVSLLGSSDFIEDVRFAPYCRAYVFRDEKGRGIAAVWCHKTEVDESREDAPTAQASFGDSLEAVVDMVGSRRRFVDGQFAVTPQPLYFVSRPGRLNDLLAAVKRFRVTSGPAANLVEVSFNPGAPDATAVCVKSFTGETTNYLEKVETPFSYEDVSTARCRTAKSDYSAFLVRRVPEGATAGTIAWPTVPTVRLPNRGKGASPGFEACYQLAWNKAGIYLRVSVKDSRFVHVEDPDLYRRHDNDCLRILLDACANARFNHRRGFDDDDYVYDVYPSADGRSARVFRRRSPDIQLTLGTYAPRNGIFADELPASFEKTRDGYVYTVTMPAKYVLPLRLEKGRVVGFGLIVSDANDASAPFGKRSCGTLSNAIGRGSPVYERPEFWPAALLWD